MIETFIPHDEVTLKKLSDSFINKTYGKVKIIEILGKRIRKKRTKTMVKTLCECGNSRISSLSDVKNGHTKSCGCLRITNNNFVASSKHGELIGAGKSRSPEYTAWCRIRRYWNLNIRDPEYCARWTELETGFLNFLKDMGRRPGPHYRLKRIDMKRGFFRDNCIWTPIKAVNKRTSYYVRPDSDSLDRIMTRINETLLEESL